MLKKIQISIPNFFGKIDSLISEGKDIIDLSSLKMSSDNIFIPNCPDDIFSYKGTILHKYIDWKDKIKKLKNLSVEKINIEKEFENIDILCDADGIGGAIFIPKIDEKNKLLQNIMVKSGEMIKWLRKIKDLSSQAKKEYKDFDDSSLIEIYYNNKTGVGYVENKRFLFKNHQPEFFVFREMYRKIKSPVPKEKVLSLASKSENYHNPEGSDIITYFINDLSKKMRKRTGLNKDQISNNNGCLTLVGKKVNKIP
mgnify:CR=1 FL=1